MCSIHALLALVTVLSCTAHIVLAAPPSLRPRQNQNASSGDHDDPSTIKPTIWIPLAVIAALFVFGTIVACCGRRFRSGSLLSWATGAAQAAGAATGTTPSARELTADQLAGSAAAAGNTNGAGAGSNRARRPRRTRRTPSQISTHSLPAYMKEPGDQEIVIVRGADELEDEIPITVTMPPLDEHGSDSLRGSFDITRPSSMYTPHPLTANDVPLLHSNDLDAQHLSPDQRPLTTRASFDSTMSSMENGSQHNYADEAPAYETVILNDPPTSTDPASAPGAASSPTHARTSTEQSGTGTTRRRSVFASIFNPRNSRGASAAAPHPPPPAVPTAASPEPRSSTGHGHTREGSGPSIMSVPASERDQRRSRILRHHPSHSGSGSMFSLLSRTRSGQNLPAAEGLTSPSMISLHSISSPLSHTLVKTEFTYPKGGPTADQLKLISSRESLARFGKPYGADAIAFAASASRAELEPPPGFDEIVGSSGAGPSSSPQQGRDTPGSDSPDEQADDLDAHEAPGSSPEISRVLPGAAEVDSPVEVTSAGVLPSVSTTASHANADAATAQPSSPSSSTSTDLAAESSHPPPGLSAQSESPPSSSPEPPQPAPSTTPAATTKPLTPTAAPTANANAPPSAFKTFAPTAGLPARAASRASSFMSYATAEESLHSPGTPFDSRYDLHGRDDDDAYESAAETPETPDGSAPPTPRMGPRHVLEGTDATVTPGR